MASDSDSAKWFKLLVLCSAMMYVIQSSLFKSKEQCMSAGFYMRLADYYKNLSSMQTDIDLDPEQSMKT